MGSAGARRSNTKAETPANIAKNSESTAEVLASLVGGSEAIDRLLAKHPKAGADLLEKLSHSSDKATRKAVCLNPNTSKETLVRLAPQFPGDFFQNPAFDWLLLEDPNLLFDIGGGVLKNILKRPECPVSFLKWAASRGDEGQQLAAAMNPITPVESLRELLKSARQTVVAAARGHAALAGELTPVESDPEVAFLAGIAEALANLSAEEASDLLEKGYLGKHHVPALASEVQFQVLEGYNLLTEASRFKHPPDLSSILSEIVEKRASMKCEAYAQSSDPFDRSWAAGSPNCPAPVLESLAKDMDKDIRESVAKNPSCPAPVLEPLAKDMDNDVRKSVAKNPSCPASVLEALAKDMDFWVREEVAKNPNSPEPLLEALAKDKHPIVVWGLAENPSLPASMSICLAGVAKKGETVFRKLLARNPSCPADVFVTLSKYTHKAVRRSLAENPSCPVDVLVMLSKDADKDICRSLAQNPNCPVDVLVMLSKDADRDICRSLAQNPNCPVDVLRFLSKEFSWCTTDWLVKNPSCPLDVLDMLSKDKSPIVRSKVVEHPNCPVNVLETLSRDEISYVRSTALSHPNCPEDILTALHEDENRTVRWTCMARNSGLVRSLASANGRQHWIDKELKLRGFASASHQGKLEEMHLWPTKAVTAKGANHGNALIRAIALFQPDALIEALSKNQKHVSWLVRAAIARNRNCPELVLNALAKDSHQVVLGLARTRQSKAAEERSNAAGRINELRETSPDLSLLLDALEQSLTKFSPPSPKLGHALIPWLSDAGRKKLLAIHFDGIQGPCLFAGVDEKHFESLVRLGVGCVEKYASPLNAHLASDPACPPKLIGILAKSRNCKVLSSLAGSPNCPATLLETLANHKDYIFPRGASTNPNCPATLLETLSKHEDSWVRENVACNPNCPVTLLKALLKDKDLTVRQWVARNPNCPAAWFKALSRRNSSIRFQVAYNPNCPVALLETLAQDRDSEVRGAVAKNPNCPVALLEIWSEDKEIRGSVASNPNCPVALLEIWSEVEDHWVRKSVAGNPNCPVALLESLSNDENNRVRESVAGNPNCPVALLESLSKDENNGVRQSIAGNPRTPLALLQLLLLDKHRRVRFLAARNLSDPDREEHQQLLESAANANRGIITAVLTPRRPLTLEDCIYPDCPPKLKLLAALQSDCPKDQLFKSANSADPQERLAAVLNPMLPTAQVMRLLDDPDVNVQRAAAQHPNMAK